MTTTRHARLLILGSGPAGYTAAVYAARANLKPVLIAGIAQGGQLMTTTDVDNWPADADGVQGPDLMQRFQKHAERFETEVVSDQIHTVRLGEPPVGPEGGSPTHPRAAPPLAPAAPGAAPGPTARSRGLPAEQRVRGRGVSACATCDGFFFKGQDVVVVGGGNTAVEEALYLANICKSVVLVHRPHHVSLGKINHFKLVEQSPCAFLAVFAWRTIHYLHPNDRVRESLGWI